MKRVILSVIIAAMAVLGFCVCHFGWANITFEGLAAGVLGLVVEVIAVVLLIDETTSIPGMKGFKKNKEDGDASETSG